MAEQKLERPRVRVSQAWFVDGVMFFDMGTHTSLKVLPNDEKKRLQDSRKESGAKRGQAESIELELDRSLGGLVVRYDGKQGARTALVPMSHVKSMDLVE